MAGANFMDEVDCGNFFDDIDDFLDFPNEDVDADLGAAAGDYDSFPSIYTGGSSDALIGTESVFSGNSASDLSTELSVPYEDIVQLEWLSNFVEDSFSGGGMTMDKTNINPSSTTTTTTKDSTRTQFQTASPVSVLESSSSCSNGKTIPTTHEKRARTKRPRPATFNPRPPLISPTSSLSDTPQDSVFIPCTSSDSVESNTLMKPPKPEPTELPKQKKKIKILPPSKPKHQNPNPNEEAPQAARKCLHCEITKTPQWRAGPMGPKTLCNACGVRFKSGRLYPEYRPAASPTFIPSVHSNSHKKVIEMRTKGCPENPLANN